MTQESDLDGGELEEDSGPSEVIDLRPEEIKELRRLAVQSLGAMRADPNQGSLFQEGSGLQILQTLSVQSNNPLIMAGMLSEIGIISKETHDLVVKETRIEMAREREHQGDMTRLQEKLIDQRGEEVKASIRLGERDSSRRFKLTCGFVFLLMGVRGLGAAIAFGLPEFRTLGIALCAAGGLPTGALGLAGAAKGAFRKAGDSSPASRPLDPPLANS